jgi:hypothetical protein
MVIPEQIDRTNDRLFVLDAFLEVCIERNLDTYDLRGLIRYALVKHVRPSDYQLWVDNYEDYLESETVRFLMNEYLCSIPEEEFQTFINMLDNGLRSIQYTRKRGIPGVI